MSRAAVWAAVLGLLAAGSAAPAAAQDRPLVFIHGYRSSGPTWADAALRLKTQLAVETMHPNLEWRNEFAAQASQLHSTVYWVPGTPLAIAHSNGGIVAREWSRLRPLSGILTLSSPNQGAPIANNAIAFANYNYQIASGILNLNTSFANPNEGSFWIYHVIQGALAAAAETIDVSLFSVLGGGMELRSPAFQQERVGSSFMQALNSSANLAREAQAVPRRVSIVTSVDDYHLGGVVRASMPERTGLFRASLYAAVGTLDYWGAQIASSGDPRDLERSQRILYVALLLSLHEGMWCQAVSDPTPLAVSFGGRCYPNDSVIPSWSHVLPGAVSIPVPSAPEHILQTGYVTPLLYDILTAHMGVAPRVSGGGGSSVLLAEQQLLAGQVLHSPDRRYRLAYQSDGNLVVYRYDNTPVWWTGTSGSPGYARMQGDGNFVVYNASHTAVWHTHTYGNPGAYLSMQNNGSFVIRRADHVRLWGSPTPANEVDGGGGSGGGGSTGGGAETLTAGMRLYPGQATRSRDGRFALTYQTDGNLVLYGPGGTARWSTQVFSSPGYAEMQHDGNFVVYASDGSPRWASGTAGAVNARLVVHDDGNVVIYNSANAAIWATHTGGS